MVVPGIVGCYNGSRTRGTKYVEKHCSMQIYCFKKIIWFDMNDVKKYSNAKLHRAVRAVTDEPE